MSQDSSASPAESAASAEAPSPPDVATLDAADAAALPAAREGFFVRAARGAWRFFTSLRCGLILLGLISIAMIRASLLASDGTLGPEAIPEAKNQVYGTWWFSTLLLLFGVQLVISTWHITRASLTVFGLRSFRRSEASFQQAKYLQAFEVSPDRRAGVLAALRKFLTFSHEDGPAFFGHRGLLNRLGPTIVHIGIITVLAGGLMWAYLERSGQIITEGRWIAAEGEPGPWLFVPKDRTRAMSSVNQEPRPLVASIRLLDFEVRNHPNSDQPADYASTIEFTYPGQPVRRARIDMNNPCVIDGLIYHQSAYVPMPGRGRSIVEVWDTQENRRVETLDAGPGAPIPLRKAPFDLRVSSDEPGAAWSLSKAGEEQPLAWGFLDQSPLSNADDHTSHSHSHAMGSMGAANPDEFPGPKFPAYSPAAFGVVGVADSKAPGGDPRYIVRWLEHTTAYATILSVITVNPALDVIYIGVATVFLGAMLTFLFKYRQVFGLFLPGANTLLIAMQPHRTHSNASEDFAALLARLEAAGAVKIALPAAMAANRAHTGATSTPAPSASPTDGDRAVASPVSAPESSAHATASVS